MTTKFDVGDIVEIKSESICVKYEVISIVITCKKDINYEIKDFHGRNRIVEEDKLVKARMTKVEARNKALEYIDSYLAEHDNDDYYISIRQKERFNGPYYYVCAAANHNREIIEDKAFSFSKEGK